MRILSLLTLACILCACDRWPTTYAVPEQHVEEPRVLNLMVDMGSPDVSTHIVSGIGGDLHDGSWRWTGRSASLRLLATQTSGLKYCADFSLWDTAMLQTGPVTLTFLVNGKILDRIRYTTPGAKHFEKPVPAGWLSAAADTVLSAEIDKVYVAPLDGAQFGFILSRMGFLPE